MHAHTVLFFCGDVWQLCCSWRTWHISSVDLFSLNVVCLFISSQIESMM